MAFLGNAGCDNLGQGDQPNAGRAAATTGALAMATCDELIKDPSGATLLGPSLQLADNAYCVTGSIALDVNGNGQEVPVEGAKIWVEGHEDMQTTSAAAGTFVLPVTVADGLGLRDEQQATDTPGASTSARTGVRPQQPLNVFSTYDQDGKSFGKRLTNLLFAGGKVLDIGKLTLAETGAIKGRVTLADQSSALGTEAYIPGTSFIAKAADDGNFVILYVPEGEYGMVFERDGYYFKSLSGVRVISKEVTLIEPVVLSPKDTSAPDTNILTGPPSFSKNQNATFTFASTDEGHEFLCKVDNGNFDPCRSPYTITALGEGQHTFAVMAQDGAGNRDQSAAEYNWSIDITAPVIVVEEQPLSLITTSGTTIKLSIDDASAELQCQLDEQPLSCGTTIALTNLTQGFHSLQAKATDKAGNPSAIKIINWMVDLSELDTIVLQEPASLTSSALATIAFAANKTATFECKLDAAAWQACSSPVTYSNLADGNHQFQVRAKDTVGNVDASPVMVSWEVDSSAPNAPNPTAISGNLTNDATPLLQWTDSTVDIQRFEVEVDITTSFNSTQLRSFRNQTTTSVEVVPQLNDGLWYFRVRAVDTAGNLSGWSSALGFQIDTQPPEVPVANYLPDPFNDTRPTFTWTAAVDASKYRLQAASDASFSSMLIDKSDITSTSYQPQAELAQGVVFWKVAAIDTAGNQSDFSLPKYFTIDTSAPGTPVINAITTPTKITTPTFSWSAVNGASKYEIQISPNANFTSFTVNNAAITTTSFTTTALTDNIYYWRVAAIDTANNRGGFSEPQQFVIDTVAPPAPTLTQYSPSPGNDLTPTLVWSNPGGGAVKYDILIKQGATTLINETGLTQLTYTPTVALPVGAISWQVRAVDAAGNVGSYAAASTLELSNAAAWRLRFLRDRRILNTGTSYGSGAYDRLKFYPGIGAVYYAENFSNSMSSYRFEINNWNKSNQIPTNGTSYWTEFQDSEGNLQIINGYNSLKIVKYNPSSNSWTSIGETPAIAGIYLYPWGVAVDDADWHILYTHNFNGNVLHTTFNATSLSWGTETLIAPGGITPVNLGGSPYSNVAFPSIAYDTTNNRVGLMYYAQALGLYSWRELINGTWVEQGTCFASITGDPCKSDSIHIPNGDTFQYRNGKPEITNVANAKDITWDGTTFKRVSTTAQRLRVKSGGGTGEEDTFLNFHNGVTMLTFPIEDDNGQELTSSYSNEHYKSNSITTNNFGNPLVLVQNMLASKSELAVSIGHTAIDVSPNIGKYTSVAFTTAGDPRIAYYDAVSRKLKLAEKVTGSWTTNIIDTGTDVGQYASLALKSNGKGVIAYFDANLGQLKVATEGAGSWSTYAVDTATNVGQYTSLAIRSDDSPVVAYYDATGGNLKLAIFDGSTWIIETVAASGDVGRSASLQLDASNNPRITYYDATNGDLVYSAWDGAAWSTTTVDTAGDVGSFASLALKSNGFPMIAYYDASNGDLKFAEWDGSTWVITILESPGDVGQHVSLTRDDDDRPHLTYYDATNTNLKYGNRDTNWAFRVMDGDDTALQDKGQYSSIKLNPTNDAPSASFFDGSEGGINFVEGMVLY